MLLITGVRSFSGRQHRNIDIFRLRDYETISNKRIPRVMNTGLQRRREENIATRRDEVIEVESHALFLSSSSSGSDNDQPSPSKTRKTTAMLGRTALSGMLAYAYLKFYAYAALATFVYYLCQHTMRNKKLKNSEWVFLGGGMIAMGLVQRILTPVRFVASMLVNTFVLYFVVNLAQGNLGSKS